MLQRPRLHDPGNRVVVDIDSLKTNFKNPSPPSRRLPLTKTFEGSGYEIVVNLDNVIPKKSGYCPDFAMPLWRIDPKYF